MKTDALHRRLRHAAPSPRKGRLHLTEADLLVFEAIARHGPLPTHYLYEFSKSYRRDYTHLQNRLTEFYNGDADGAYLTRPPRQFAAYAARYQHLVYALAPRAERVLAERGRLSQRARPATTPFIHQLMLSCVAASFELSARSRGLRYIPRAEILSHPKCHASRVAKDPLALPLTAGGARVVPDDLFGLEYPSAGFRFFALEVDRHTESIERANLASSAFGRKVESYLAVLANRTYVPWWGVPNLTVLTITTSALHAANIMQFIKRQVDARSHERMAIRAETCFGANWRVPQAVLEGLLSEAWMTPGEPKDIGRA